MRKTVIYENYCQECGHTWDTRGLPGGNCPKCGREDPYRNPSITCDCGTRVYLDSNTNECLECGRLYNQFGQSLKPRSEWEEDY